MQLFSHPQINTQIPAVVCNDLPSLSVYSAIYEFKQGSAPTIIWTLNSLSMSFEEEFMWYIVSTPRSYDSDQLNPLPSQIISSYNGLQFYALFTSIPDIEARGFSRWICLVFASQNGRDISLFQDENAAKLSKMLINAQNKALCTFASDIPSLTLAISEVLKNQDHPDRLMLESKLVKLQFYAENITLDENYVCELHPASTELITDNLRDLKELIDLESLQNEIRSLINVPLINSYAEELNYLKKNRVLKHCLYCILGGRTLVIMSQRHDFSRRLAESLIILSFRRWMGDVGDYNVPISSSEALRHLIVVAPDVINPNIEMISILNIDDTTYSGLFCPDQSQINKISHIEKRIQPSILSYRVRTIIDDFFTFSHLRLHRSLTCNEDIRNAVSLGCISAADIPLYAFWTASKYSKDEIRPILRDNFRHNSVGKMKFGKTPN